MLSSTLDAQVFRSSDTLNQRRVVGITAAGLAGYGGGMYLLGQAWYKNNLSSKFHFFNDDGEWLQMDKVGHVYSGYNESSMVYEMYRWAGVRESKAIWLGLGAGLLAQTSIEIFDGFSTKWGFSWGDIVCNFAGYSLFGLQQGIWHQQRILLKVSSDFRSYSAMPLLSVDGSATDNLARRAKDLYSNHLPGKLLKDYNAQTYWLSFNPSAFAGKESRWPAYLNIALGYSGENLFGGYVNTWSFNGASFQLDPAQYPRYRQFLLSLDLDLRKIPCKSPFWKTVLRVVNIFKIPAPALEFNSQGKFKAHWLYF
ncbi:MAG: DUF2279 domain-containing protein [Saprospiraceae bacterium]|nr:DUF2279 domain-containing protein [Saprospiraceae bacterium]